MLLPAREHVIIDFLAVSPSCESGACLQHLVKCERSRNMGLFGNIGKTISGVVDESIREALSVKGEDLANANSKMLQDVLNQLNAQTFPRDMTNYLQRSGLTDDSITRLPTQQILNILSGANSPLRDLHQKLQIDEHLFDTCKAVVDTIKE